MSEEQNQISIDDFAKIELKVGKVLSCERVPKSKKLIKMQVDLGNKDIRQILAGIGPWYLDDEMIGKRVVVVANLAPASLMGHESQGMVLAASAGDSVCLVQVPEGLPVGSTVS